MIGDQLFMEQLDDKMSQEKFPHQRTCAILVNELYKISLIWQSNLSPVDRQMMTKYIAIMMLRYMTTKEIKQLGAELQNGGR